MHHSPERLRALLQVSWSAETSRQWRPGNPARGQCNVTALVVNDICGGDLLKTETAGGWHFYTRVKGVRYDLTESQFEAPVHYADVVSNRAEALAGTEEGNYTVLKERVVRLLVGTSNAQQ